MPAYDFWEPLSVRLTSVALSLLSGPGETCEYTHNRARAVENMIHARVVPIGLLRETAPLVVTEDVAMSVGNRGDELTWFTVDTSA